LLLEPDLKPHYDAWAKARTPEATNALLTKVQPQIDRALRIHVGETSPLVAGQAKRLVVDSCPNTTPSGRSSGRTSTPSLKA
jgi:hypothetical protein